MLEPKKLKHPKQFRGKMRGNATRGNRVTVGEFGLQAMGRGWMTSRQLEAARKAIVMQTKRKGKLWVRVFPDKPYTKKPAEVRMGGGKGDVEGYVVVIKPGRVLFELSGVDDITAQEAFEKASDKLPIKSRFIKK